MSKSDAAQMLPSEARASNFTSRAVFALARRLLAQSEHGALRLTLPNRDSSTFGGDRIGPSAHIDVRRPAVLSKALIRGSCGFAEAYMAGDWETESLADVFRYYCENADAMRSGRQIFKTKLSDRIWHLRRANTRAGSRRNIAHHYDLGNAFYALWLDAGMTYSSGVFDAGVSTLEDAQECKYERVLKGAGIRPDCRVLEIGCGWGGFAERAARAGAHVTGLTLSNEQLTYATQRIRDAGLSDLCDLRLQDYRDVTGTFDAVVSIEMIEAVGEENWPTYFGVLRDRLAPGGTAVVQGITISEKAFPRYRRSADFVQRYIFPGGMLPTRAIMLEEARKAGLSPVAVETFGQSYAETLWIWRDRFLENWPAIREFGYDERFRRMWDYYLTYCAVGFEKGMIDVGLYKFHRH